MADEVRDATEVPKDDLGDKLFRTGAELIEMGRNYMRTTGQKRKRSSNGGTGGDMPRHEPEASTSGSEVQDGAPGELDKTTGGVEGTDGRVSASAGAKAPTTPKLDDGTQVCDEDGDERPKRMATTLGPYARRPVGGQIGPMVRWMGAERAIEARGRMRGWNSYQGPRYY